MLRELGLLVVSIEMKGLLTAMPGLSRRYLPFSGSNTSRDREKPPGEFAS